MSTALLDKNSQLHETFLSKVGNFYQHIFDSSAETIDFTHFGPLARNLQLIMSSMDLQHKTVEEDHYVKEGQFIW